MSAHKFGWYSKFSNHKEHQGPSIKGFLVTLNGDYIIETVRRSDAVNLKKKKTDECLSFTSENKNIYGSKYKKICNIAIPELDDDNVI